MHIIFSAILLCLKFKCAACLEVNKFLNVLFAWLNVKGPYFWEFPADLVTFTEEILNGKLPFLCSDSYLTGSLLVKRKQVILSEILKKNCLTEMLYAIWYHLYNLNNVKNTDGGVLLLVKLQASTCNFTKSITPQWVFFTIFKLYKRCNLRKASHILISPW